jgi:hypothetical protein
MSNTDLIVFQIVHNRHCAGRPFES